MRYKVVLVGIDDSIEVNAEDFDIDADARSIVFYNHGNNKDDPDISVAWFSMDRVAFVNAKSNS